MALFRYEAQEFADDEVLNEGAEVPGTEKRPNPMEDRHPTTRETLLHVAARQEKVQRWQLVLYIVKRLECDNLFLNVFKVKFFVSNSFSLRSTFFEPFSFSPSNVNIS